MKKNLLTIGIGLLFSAMALPVAAQVVNDDNEDGVVKLNADRSKYDYVQGQVLVKFKDETPVQITASRGKFRAASANKVNSVLTKFGVDEMEQLLPNENPNRTMRRSKAFNGTIVRERDLSQLYRIKLSEKHIQEVEQLVDELKGLDEVEFAEPNYKVYMMDANIAASFGTNPYTTQQWYLDNYGVKQLWNKPIVNPKRPVIAIIDTGVDLTHPDIAPNLWTNQAEAEGEANYDNDGNGFKGDVHGWDFINNTPKVKDFNMHGTHVAGIAAAANNSIGIVGANPRALIMPVSVMQSDGTGDVATIVKGIDYAVQNGATVLNLSLGTYANSRAMRQALERAYQSAVIVAAAGNDGRCINSPHHPKPCWGAAPMFPAAYSFVLGVQATQSNGTLAGFSNYDDDGNTFSAVTTFQDPDGFNYELKAPGTDMLSTIPGGKYKALNGTSMAAPLVAGSISALMMVKNYDSQEILWGDLLHTDNIAQAYAVAARPAELDMLQIQMRNRKELADETEEDYSGDHEIDAGETVSIYPVIRTTFGAASNIKMKLEMGDLEDPSTVEILTPGWVDFGLHLDAYGKGVSLNPMQLKIANNVTDGRHIKMKFTAKCDETSTSFVGHFTIVVNNGIKIGGMIESDITLYPNQHYIVNSNLAIPPGVKLTIKPGVVLKFKDNVGISCNGTIDCVGTKDSMIVFRPADLSQGIILPLIFNDTFKYVKIQGLSGIWSGTNYYFTRGNYEDCVFDSNSDRYWFAGGGHMLRCNITNHKGDMGIGNHQASYKHCNIIDNQFRDKSNVVSYNLHPADVSECNVFSNFCNSINNELNLEYFEMSPSVYNGLDSYMGSSTEYGIRKGIVDISNPTYPHGYGLVNIDKVKKTPYAEAHGIVWKVVVNGKDAQDEYEDLAPLGVGKQKFEVYFNRPMNKEVVPNISFGVRDPYTQNAVAEDGSWNEDGTIYTAYKTITGKTKSDGINRIYVYGAEDDEYFEIPYEKTRFNFMINAAGSMATGFAGEAQMGRVKLTWNNENNNFDDAMGFNVYRFNPDVTRTIPAHYDENWNWIEETQVVDTIRINQEIVDIETTEYTDYDVTPGETYYYMYKALSTDLQEFDASNVVAVTPLTATLGDADGSGDVKVPDVISTVNYILGENPKPFIFEAADVNTDRNVDVIDVIGIIQMILNQPAGARSLSGEDVAQTVYTIEDGVLYIETPVEIAGLQIQLSLNNKEESIKTTETLKGFEVASTWLTENDYRMLAYSFGSKTLTPGKHAIMTIGNADITSLRLSDTQGNSVLAVPGEATAINDAMGSKVINSKGVWNLSGQKVNSEKNLKKGVYIINGQKVVK